MKYHENTELIDNIEICLKIHCEGKENARTIEILSNYFGLKRRVFETITEIIRRRGTPLCSSCSKPYGLYIARTYEEAKPWMKQIDSRLKQMATTKNIAIKALKGLALKDGVQLEMGI